VKRNHLREYFRRWSLVTIAICALLAGWWAIRSNAPESHTRPPRLTSEWVRSDDETLALRNLDRFAWTDVVAVIHVIGDREAYIKCATPRIVRPHEHLSISLHDCARSLRSRVTYLAVSSLSIKAREGEHHGGLTPAIPFIDKR
jgi:hypothetical protein